MRSIVNIVLIDDASIIILFRLFKIGFIHPSNIPGKITGILLGIWRFESQFTIGFWNKGKQEEIYHA